MSRNSTLSLKQNWKALWASSSKRLLTLSGSVIVAAILSAMPMFFQAIENRPGLQLHDFVLARIPAANVSICIFLIIWGMGLYTLIRAIKQPLIYTKYVWLYIMICVARILTITLVPLAAPAHLVELVDPLTGVFYGHATITKDLFFSGHTATLVAMCFCLPKKGERIAAAVASVIVGILLLVQHVHYTIDVLAAPVFVFALNKILEATLFAENHIE
ncbi:phosphatase PAP2-related protein [Mucilaginibacter lacusdianchii]|uniref:phosphatase PAP2-related protein n=1 Tax=Mucilaginibacter lacusdianchii TaxID=2684211 RepID=UPI00131C263D|nr:phosphatase PAP2-related protein [Mucilaginibacter sp. JXJ CY 39]